MANKTLKPHRCKKKAIYKSPRQITNPEFTKFKKRWRNRSTFREIRFSVCREYWEDRYLSARAESILHVAAYSNTPYDHYHIIIRCEKFIHMALSDVRLQSFWTVFLGFKTQTQLSAAELCKFSFLFLPRPCPVGPHYWISATWIEFTVNSLAPSAHRLKGQTAVGPHRGTNNVWAARATHENQLSVRARWMWLLPVQDKSARRSYEHLSEFLPWVSLQLWTPVVEKFILSVQGHLKGDERQRCSACKSRLLNSV